MLVPKYENHLGPTSLTPNFIKIECLLPGARVNGHTHTPTHPYKYISYKKTLTYRDFATGIHKTKR